jgi:hypothetical protein
MEFFYFRVEEFFVYGGDNVAENYVGQFYKHGPYVHSRLSNFHTDVGNIADNHLKSGASTLKTAIENLEHIRDDLQREANIFLSPWGGSFEKASQDLFGLKADKNN